ncbi:hypothetical protein P3T39_002251 [Kitasatospora sp. GP82]|nr:hypothetical protein [Kitasatospora sp. GP82]
MRPGAITAAVDIAVLALGRAAPAQAPPTAYARM